METERVKELMQLAQITEPIYKADLLEARQTLPPFITTHLGSTEEPASCLRAMSEEG